VAVGSRPRCSDLAAEAVRAVSQPSSRNSLHFRGGGSHSDVVDFRRTAAVEVPVKYCRGVSTAAADGNW